MINPLIIAHKTFSNNLIQGPLAGYSCAPLRVLAQRLGQPAFCYTEMISARHLINNPYIEPRFSYKDPAEGPLCVQLSGNDPLELAKAVEKVICFGADLIDLNCGCPVNKIRKKGSGSKLLEDAKHLAVLVKAMKSVSPLPISIKIRVDGEHPNKYSVEAAKHAQDAGIDFITVHGRHWTEDYDVPCRHDQIAQIVAALDIPVIANGDAHDTPSTLALLKNTGAAGAMIARAGMGQPWLFAQIRAEAAGLPFTRPTERVIGELFLEHVQQLMKLEPEIVAVLQSRTFIKYYARPLKNKALLLQEANLVKKYDELVDCISTHFY